MQRTQLVSHLATLLETKRFKDYAPNGLQVEGTHDIQRVITGVTASLATIEAAIDAGADALIVHHGLFWRGQDACVTGFIHQRLKAILQANLNLFAYHLPLDAHRPLGNNAQLAERFGLLTTGFCGDQDLIFLGQPVMTEPFATPDSMIAHIEQVLGRKILAVGCESLQKPISKLAWCSGAAQNYFLDAIHAGVQVFISGEISEPQYHLAKEYGVAYLACGHHATERFGVQALGRHIATHFPISHQFIDVFNPI